MSTINELLLAESRTLKIMVCAFIVHVYKPLSFTVEGNITTVLWYSLSPVITVCDTLSVSLVVICCSSGPVQEPLIVTLGTLTGSVPVHVRVTCAPSYKVTPDGVRSMLIRKSGTNTDRRHHLI